MRTLLLTLTLIFNFALFTTAASGSNAADHTQATGGKAVKKANNSDKAVETPPAPTGPPIVKRVLSGDLLELESGELLRLSGADAPVMPHDKLPGQQPWADEAQKFTEQLALGKEVTIKDLGLKNDEYGRRVGLVFIGETWLDLELVKNGFAVVQPNPYIKSQEKQALVDAQREARSGFRGIWNYTNPLKEPPREFRAANRISEGDDSKADSWKRAGSTSTGSRSSNTSRSTSNSNSPSTGSANNGSANGTNGSSASVAAGSPLEAAAETLDALKKVQERLDEGVKSGELSRLIALAGEHFATIPSNTVDRALVRDIKDALDAYQLALDAFKRKETASDADRPRFKKYIDGAIEIADKSIASASQRLAQLSKR